VHGLFLPDGIGKRTHLVGVHRYTAVSGSPQLVPLEEEPRHPERGRSSYGRVAQNSAGKVTNQFGNKYGQCFKLCPLNWIHDLTIMIANPESVVL